MASEALQKSLNDEWQIFYVALYEAHIKSVVFNIKFDKGLVIQYVLIVCAMPSNA